MKVQVSYALTFLARENHTKRGVQVRLSVLILLFSAPAFLSCAIAQEVVITHGSASSQRIPEELLPEISFAVEDRLEITFTMQPDQETELIITGRGIGGELNVRFFSDDFAYNPQILRTFQITKNTPKAKDMELRAYRYNLSTGTTALGSAEHTFGFSEPPEAFTLVTVVLASNDRIASGITVEIVREPDSRE